MLMQSKQRLEAGVLAKDVRCVAWFWVNLKYSFTARFLTHMVALAKVLIKLSLR